MTDSTPDVPNPTSDTIASLLPARVRKVVYASLAAALPGYHVLDALYKLPPWVAVISAVVTGAGFSLSFGNTPRG